MALAMRQKGGSQNKQHQYIMFYCGVAGVVLHVCLSPIRVADKIAFPMVHKKFFFLQP